MYPKGAGFGKTIYIRLQISYLTSFSQLWKGDGIFVIGILVILVWVVYTRHSTYGDWLFTVPNIIAVFTLRASESAIQNLKPLQGLLWPSQRPLVQGDRNCSSLFGKPDFWARHIEHFCTLRRGPIFTRRWWRPLWSSLWEVCLLLQAGTLSLLPFILEPQVKWGESKGFPWLSLLG